ncbi:hypothetical protein K438DRAFT_1990379 [Mycena galopus ATCC 62051]|nr:hypothetical protein K438DRAFT_1990379 [Mycena galopus ATCC 62051]
MSRFVYPTIAYPTASAPDSADLSSHALYALMSLPPFIVPPTRMPTAPTRISTLAPPPSYPPSLPALHATNGDAFSCVGALPLPLRTCIMPRAQPRHLLLLLRVHAAPLLLLLQLYAWDGLRDKSKSR